MEHGNKQKCQLASKRGSVQTKVYIILNENSALFYSRLRHLTLNNTSFVKFHRISDREKSSAAALQDTGAVITESADTESFSFFLVFSLKPFPVERRLTGTTNCYQHSRDIRLSFSG